MTRRLDRSFFARDVNIVARELIGARVVVAGPHGSIEAELCEVEAYGGSDDPASHAFRGPTPRCEVMFAEPGHLYVYRSYGVHWCMNVVTGSSGVASAVLLRAARLDSPASANVAAGPGLLTRFLGVGGEHNGLDVCAPDAEIHFMAAERPGPVATTPRIGITKATERPWRYVAQGFRAPRAPRRAARASR